MPRDRCGTYIELPLAIQLLSKSGFNFDAEVILELVKSADINQDGVIQYDEFVPTCLTLLTKKSLPELAEEATRNSVTPAALCRAV